MLPQALVLLHCLHCNPEVDLRVEGGKEEKGP